MRLPASRNLEKGAALNCNANVSLPTLLSPTVVKRNAKSTSPPTDCACRHPGPPAPGEIQPLPVTLPTRPVPHNHAASATTISALRIASSTCKPPSATVTTPS